MNSMPHPLPRRQFLVQAAAGALATRFPWPAVVRAASNQWGDLMGRFSYDGLPPQRKRLKVDKDLEYTAKLDIRDESLLVGPAGGLANVYVYLRNAKASICPEFEADVAKQVVLDNRGWIFQPHCMIVWRTKQEFSIVNSDPVAQNVAFTPLGDVPANIVLPVGGKAVYKFARRQSYPIPIACNYHPWERAYVLPRDNPFATISAVDGTFSIAKLPVGQWQFQAWHERVGYLDRPDWPKGRFTVTIKSGVNDLGTIKIAPSVLEG
jgi:hypothetical protein